MDEPANTTEIALHHLTTVGEFFIDRETLRVWRGNQALRLSLRQFRLLDVFMRHPGEPFSRKMLKDLIWGPESTIEEATVNAEIMRLRRAIGGPKREMPIRTARELGYGLEGPKRRARSKQRPSTSEVKGTTWGLAAKSKL